MRRLAWLGAVAVAVLGTACSGITGTTQGSGRVVTKTFSVGPFTGLRVSQAFIVNVSLADEQAVQVRVDDNLVDLLDVGTSDDTLHIGLTPGTSVRRATLEADVTVRSLASVDLSGASQVRWATVQEDNLDLEMSGASRATLTGKADRLTISASGASQLEGVDLLVKDLGVTLSGASQATVSVSDTIAAELSGASQLHYKGSPTFTKKDLSGASIAEPA